MFQKNPIILTIHALNFLLRFKYLKSRELQITKSHNLYPFDYDTNCYKF